MSDVTETGPTITCPYCLRQHTVPTPDATAATTSCPSASGEIPKAFIRDQMDGCKTTSLLFIGYGAHGKTTYLSSFLYSLYEGEPVAKWEGFCPLPLQEQMRIRIKNEYLAALRNGSEVARSESFSRTSLIIELNHVPLGTKVGPITLGYHAESKVVLNLYDIGGEVYEMESKIREKLDIIAGLRHLVLLVDPTELRARAGRESSTPSQLLQSLLAALCNVIDELDQRKSKDLIVCFTKADLMWGDPDFGPLAVRDSTPFPTLETMPDYVRELDVRSKEIAQFAKREYGVFHNTVQAYFKNSAYCAVSALGSQPVDKQIPEYRPYRVIDPLLWLWKMEGWM